MDLFDALIIGGGVSGMQCALVLGSAKEKKFAANKKIGMVIHQKSSHLQNALFNNVLGQELETLGKDLLIKGKEQITEKYPHIQQFEDEKVISISCTDSLYTITTNKNLHTSNIVILALNYSKPFTIDGLSEFIEPHKKTNPIKNRIQLRNNDHLVQEGLYVCGTLAGWRSQFAIAAGSGASVATDILTLWNDGNHTKIHDKI